MRRFPAILLLVPLLMASKCRKRVTDDTAGSGLGDANPPTVELQVISLDPDEIAPGVSWESTVYGSAFEDGARVWVGDDEVASVRYRSANTLRVTGAALELGTYDVKVRNPEGESATLRGGLIVQNKINVEECSLIRVNFAYDSDVLTAEAQQLLGARRACFQETSGVVIVDGHCDERGTTEYNLALGQRRAQAVSRYLTSQGVSPARVRAISYGEERPLASGHDEAAYAQNRRADISIRD